VHRLLLNLLLRVLVKPIWRRAPPIEQLRQRAALVDRRFSGKTSPPPGVGVRVSETLNAQWVGPAGQRRDGALLYLHGGAFCVHLPATYHALCNDLAARTGLPVLLPDYRLAPEHPAPCALDDCELAYRHLLRETRAERIVLMGDSAGGNLALALLQRCRVVGLPMPAGAVLMSPVTEFVGDGWSMHFNARRDLMFTPEALELVVGHYLPRMPAGDPQVSPLLGDWHGLPPLRFHVSSSEMLLDHSLRAVERARMAGVDAQAKVWLDLPHAFPIFGMLREAADCRAEMAQFVSALMAVAAAQTDEKRIAQTELAFLQ
jgi:monoterpene epsilon-lactone hydrolase